MGAIHCANELHLELYLFNEGKKGYDSTVDGVS
jgi:hypothetical protein